MPGPRALLATTGAGRPGAHRTTGPVALAPLFPLARTEPSLAAAPGTGTPPAARAIALISDLAHIYQGSLDHPFGPYISEIPSSRTEPAPPEPASQDTVLIPTGEVKTILAALDIAADYQRDRAELCSECTNQSCPDLRIAPPGRPGI